MFLRTLMITSLCFLEYALAESTLVDLGVHANTYPIKEKSFKVSVSEGISELNVTKLKKDALLSIDAMIDAKYNLPLSDKEEVYTKENVYTIPYDMPSPQGGYFYRKGESVLSTMPQGTELNLCFVDARYPEVLPEIAKKFGKCIYLIANNRLDGNYPSLLKNSSDGRLYPVSDKYVERFNIKKFPTKINLVSDKINYRVLNFKEIVKNHKMGDI